MKFSKLLILSFIIILSGCSLPGTPSYQSNNGLSHGSRSSQYTRTFSVDFETVWSAALVSLDGMPLEKIDKENGIIKTGWIEGWSQRKARSIMTNRFLDDYWKERHRLVINLSRSNTVSSVTVKCQIQEKARGGSAAYRWERKPSTGEKEEETLTRIEEILVP